MYKTILVFLVSFLLLDQTGFSQQSLSGIVTDEQQQPLAFVNILINGNYTNGVSTDIDGRFEIVGDTEIKFLLFSYVGYEKLRYSLTNNSINSSTLTIQLKSTTAALPEALVIAGENPAHRIIRRAIQNRKQNNPERLKSFQCETYNKMVFEWLPNKEGLETFIAEKADKLDKKGNSIAKNRIENTKELMAEAEKRHLLIMESVSERKYLYADRSTDKVIHNRVSGFRHPSFVALANDVQPFSFYQTYIEILDKAYLNPISPGSTKKYFFNIEDSLYQQQDTVFIISYQPKKGKNFEGLKGVLYINSNAYAIQNVIAEPFDKSFIKMKIEQKYTFVKDKQWFPKQLNFVMEATEYPDKLIGTRVSGRSYIRSVQLEPEFKKKDFRVNGYTTAKNANTQSDSVWQKYRPQVLTGKEAETYVFMDSLGKKHNFDALLNMTEALASGRLPIGKLDILLTKVLNFNEYENTRLGLGLATNDRLSRFFELGAYGAYGFRDKAWKYGGYAQVNILSDNRLRLRYDYQEDIIEPGLNGFETNSSIFTRRLYATRMDSWQQQQLSLQGKLMPGVYFNTSLSKSQWTPNYEYEFLDYDVAISSFDFAEVGLDLRFVFREKIARFLGTEMSETKYPKLFFSYRKGFESFLDGKFDYQKVLVALEDDFRIRNLGKTSFRVEAGWTEGSLPFGRLFSGNGIGRGFQWVEVENTFQTMDLYEFLSDRFVHFFFMHNFETHLLKIKNWKPEISVVQNVAFGALENPEFHSGVEVKSMEKGFYEAGLVIDNLYRFKYLNILYLGIGGGVYYRYGAYAFSDYSENLAYRFRVMMSF